MHSLMKCNKKTVGPIRPTKQGREKSATWSEPDTTTLDVHLELSAVAWFTRVHNINTLLLLL